MRIMTIQDFTTKSQPNWCPGCGNYGIITALKQALVELNVQPKNTVIVSGIGCSSKLPHWVKTFGFHSLHGRGLAIAQGVKLANPKLTVIAVGGDGDGYGIGMAHFIHALRRNIDLLYIVHNNGVYGLTKGQIAPTGQIGFISPTTPFGSIEEPINPIKLAMGAGGTFIARGFADQIEHLKNLFISGIKHSGFGFIDVLQPCIAFNKINTREWYKERIYLLKTMPKNYNEAMKLAQEKTKIPLGIFWQKKTKNYDELYQVLNSKN